MPTEMLIALPLTTLGLALFLIVIVASNRRLQRSHRRLLDSYSNRCAAQVDLIDALEKKAAALERLKDTQEARIEAQDRLIRALESTLAAHMGSLDRNRSPAEIP